MRINQLTKDILLISGGVMGTLILIGFGMRAFDEFASWIRSKRKE